MTIAQLVERLIVAQVVRIRLPLVTLFLGEIMLDAQTLSYLVEMVKVGGAYGVLGLAIYSVSPAITICSSMITLTACITFLNSWLRKK